MPSTAENKLCFNVDWKTSILLLLFFPLLISLGNWQLHRAQEKQQLQQLYQQRQMSPPQSIALLSNSEQMRYQPVVAEGKFLADRNILLDNKIFHGRFGYELITAFKLTASDQILWVNRGWLAADSSRQTLPRLPSPAAGLQRLTGELYIPHGEMLTLADIEVQGWPRVVSDIDINKLQQELTLPMFPYTMRLAAENPAVLTRNWMLVNIEPAKHTAYAVQWFVMAAVAVLIGLLANTNIWQLCQRRKQTPESES